MGKCVTCKLVFQCGTTVEVKVPEDLLQLCPKHGGKLNRLGGFECDQDHLLVRDSDNAVRQFNRV